MHKRLCVRQRFSLMRVRVPSAPRTFINQDIMQEEDYTRIPITDKDGYPDRSGCAAIAAVLGFIALFWIIVGGIYLFT